MMRKDILSQQIEYAISQGLMDDFRRAASNNGIPLEILLAVASRETGIGTDAFFRQNGYVGSDGNSKGIMQISDRFHEFARITPPGNHPAYIAFGGQLLGSELERFNGNMKQALVAYNAGPDAVRRALIEGRDPDQFTTGGNYASDVLERSQIIRDILKEKGILRSNLTAVLGVSALALPLLFFNRKKITRWLQNS